MLVTLLRNESVNQANDSCRSDVKLSLTKHDKSCGEILFATASE